MEFKIIFNRRLGFRTCSDTSVRRHMAASVSANTTPDGMLPLSFYFKRSRNTDSTGDSDDCGPAAPSKPRIELDLTNVPITRRHSKQCAS